MTDINTAMVLAAGFGKRLRPITETTPKPLVPVGGKPMLDRTLDVAAEAGLTRAVVNVHYLGQQILDHCAQRDVPSCMISDERDAILETGGGVIKALPLIGQAPFVLLNADTFWIDGPQPALPAMIKRFDSKTMDFLLLTCQMRDTTGHSGSLDFCLDDAGRLSRAGQAKQGVIYAGAAIINPAAFDGAKAEPHSLNIYFDRAIKAGRLFGHVLDGGHWITVGTPQGLADAEAKLANLALSKQTG